MAQLTIQSRDVETVTILGLSGKITIGEGAVQLREAVRHALEAGKRNILLDLGNVSYVDSSGIGELVRSYTATSNQGGQLKLVHLTQKVQDLLIITKLLTIFQVFDNEQEAVASFA